METTLRRQIAASGRTPEETLYRGCPAEVLDFRLFSADLYRWEEQGPAEEQRLLYKNTVAAADFSMVASVLPELRGMTFRGRDRMPYFVSGLERIRAALDRGERIGVKGGPCIFSAHEVLVDVHLRSGKTRSFDYCTGRMYQWESEFSGGARLSEYLRENGSMVEYVSFRDEKRGVTPQEYANLLYAFQAAEALRAALLVIPLPDMSYKKYLAAILEHVDPGLREGIMGRFEAVLYRVSDLFLDLIRDLAREYPGVRYRVLHDRDEELCRLFYERRAPFIERGSVLHSLTAIPEKAEPIKDYISMQGLPYYLEGITEIVEVDSMDETDSYRKSRKAHRKAFDLDCILFPELLCRDGSTTIYNALLKNKGYGDLELVR